MLAASADLVNVTCGFCRAGMVSWVDSKTEPAWRAVPKAKARLVIDPLSMSVWVTVYVAEQVSVASGARVDEGQVILDSPACGSDTPTWERVAFPLFVRW